MTHYSNKGNGMTENGKINNENGFVLVASLLILLLLVVMGTSALRNATIDIQIAGNERTHKLAFYAAEAAISYVEATPALYSPNNFQDPADPQLSVSPAQTYSGEVIYAGFADSFLRGTGFEVGSNVTAHSYKMSTEGVGPNNALSRLDSGFFRIGFK
jgi:hypothetical protein